MSDREQLAARLVEAAGKAAHTADDFGRDTWEASPQDERQHFIHMGSAAVVAMLREMNDAGLVVIAGHDPIDLSGLADYIEKAES